VTDLSSRHGQLIAAGWRYDEATDRYTPPGSSRAWLNLEAAWIMAFPPARPTDPRQRHKDDDRRQEPQ
jgi:hypothetical protein